MKSKQMKKHKKPYGTFAPDNESKMSEEEIDANLMGTFPASDPPSWTLGLDKDKFKDMKKD
jgi:hypothetical protein